MYSIKYSSIKPFRDMTNEELILDTLANILLEKGISRNNKIKGQRVVELESRAGHMVKLTVEK